MQYLHHTRWDFGSGYAYASAALNEFTQRYVNRPLSFLLSFIRDWKFTRRTRYLFKISDAIDHKQAYGYYLLVRIAMHFLRECSREF